MGLYGKCELCKERITKDEAATHLESCAPEHDKKSKAVKLYNIRVDSPYTNGIHWLDIEMKAASKLESLDDFLRKVWLECCGHMSAFNTGDGPFQGEVYNRQAFEPGDKDMSYAIESLFSVGSKFGYVYDFGSSTMLTLDITGEREGSMGRNDVRLVIRNEMPDYTCSQCDKPAKWINSIEMYEGESSPLYCSKHQKEYDGEDDEAFLLFLNSPRTGECAYGSVDI